MSGRSGFRRVFIANRGEIAVRIARACREMGIVSVAAVSEADRSAFHARVADEVVEVGPPPPLQSYLDIERIVAAAREARCDAVHPGYGFLSQNPAFAEAVEAAGLVFVGPPASAMRLMGDKVAARRAMQSAGVPVVPGYEEEDADDAALVRAAERIGFPLMVKAAAGGGGRGMRRVAAPEELRDALASARREAEKAFGDGRLFLERLLDPVRHVEIQVLSDGRRTLSLHERECSIQRRHQKVVEESPSPALDDERRRRMGECAVRAANAAEYRGAGTVEFLLAPTGEFYFLEMNTRLQVEHPVTEFVTGIDIVRWQLRIAAGENLALEQEDVPRVGHAIECRLNAEDPREDFLPDSGRLLLAHFPTGPGIRVDTGYETGDEISRHYDSLVAKIVVHDEDREAARRRMATALLRTAVLGVRTNLEFLEAVIAHPAFAAGETFTSFVDRHAADLLGGPSEPGDEEFLVASLLERLEPGAGPDAGPAASRFPDPWDVADSFRVGEATA